VKHKRNLRILELIFPVPLQVKLAFGDYPSLVSFVLRGENERERNGEEWVEMIKGFENLQLLDLSSVEVVTPTGLDLIRLIPSTLLVLKLQTRYCDILEIGRAHV